MSGSESPLLTPSFQEPIPGASFEKPVDQGEFHQEHEYKLLKGHYRTDGSWKSDEELRTEYLTQTDELIRQMVDGTSFTDPNTGKVTVEKPDVVIWLDKSARPVSWLAKKMWEEGFADDADGNRPKRPDFMYANIDREQWVNQVDPQGVGTVDMDKVDPTVFRSLRSLFVSPSHKKEGLTEEIDTAPSVLDGKNILIVDEVNSSGRTLTYARKFFERAIPTAKIAGSYWMGGVVQREGATGNADLPVWYKEKDVTGRGINNRNERASQASRSVTQKLGSWFLSTRFPEPDANSLQLRRELDQLVHDGDVLFAPSARREDDDFDERVARFNGGMALKAFIERRRQLHDHK